MININLDLLENVYYTFFTKKNKKTINTIAQKDIELIKYLKNDKALLFFKYFN